MSDSENPTPPPEPLVPPPKPSGLVTVAAVAVILAAAVFIYDWARKRKAEADTEAWREAEFCEPYTQARMSKTCNLKCSLIDSVSLRSDCESQCETEDLAVLLHCNKKAQGGLPMPSERALNSPLLVPVEAK